LGSRKPISKLANELGRLSEGNRHRAGGSQPTNNWPSELVCAEKVYSIEWAAEGRGGKKKKNIRLVVSGRLDPGVRGGTGGRSTRPPAGRHLGEPLKVDGRNREEGSAASSRKRGGGRA